jgi:hypothetical protein
MTKQCSELRQRYQILIPIIDHSCAIYTLVRLMILSDTAIFTLHCRLQVVRVHFQHPSRIIASNSRNCCWRLNRIYWSSGWVICIQSD